MIALITDFGYTDHFAGVIKGVIKKINPAADIIDISHDVRSFSIVNAQFILHSSYKYFPANTVFCIIIDPGVGTDRKGIIADDGTYFYVVPDNGIISAVQSDSMKLYHIDMAAFPDASATFNARDVFAPVAAGLSQGLPPERFGVPTDTAVQVPFPEYSTSKNEKKFDIIHIDKFGNAITSLPVNTIDFSACPLYSVSSGRYRFDAVCVRSYGDLYHNQCGILQGSSGFIELAEKRRSISDRFGMAVGDQIVMTPLTV
jgi:S-adenosyl-L-methionine hydrolase (adenosine-forming)